MDLDQVVIIVVIIVPGLMFVYGGNGKEGKEDKEGGAEQADELCFRNMINLELIIFQPLYFV